MASNGIQRLTPSQLSALCAQMINVIEDSAAQYGVSAAQVAALVTASADLGTTATTAESTKSAYRAAVQAREAATKATMDAAASVARSVYAHPGITNEQIAAAGLSPRSTSRARHAPETPTRVLATPQTNGTVRLEWDRAGNVPGVNFLVEGSADGASWTFVGDTPSTRTTLSGYAPGVQASFRVCASRNGAVSAPSASATIYGPASASESKPTLKLAA